MFPFSLLYDVVTRVRNLLFDLNINESTSFSIPIINIGNITVGGTGKTPHTEYLAKLLLPEFKTAMVSRGYKRLTKGVVIANKSSNASEIGDEPYQMKDKFKELNVVVAEKRVAGINSCLKKHSDTEVILLDDSYQHRHVKPGLNILLIDYNRPIWRDYLLPTGNLRESARGKKRADMIIISKCPVNFTDYQRERILWRLRSFEFNKIFFTGFKYGSPFSLKDNNKTITINKDHSVLLITGIANPQPLKQYLSNLTPEVNTLTFPDHHMFNENDIQQIAQKYYTINTENKIIITTEKDAVRLKELNLIPDDIVYNTYVIPIEVQFYFNQQASFNDQILKYVRENKTDK